MQQEFADQHQLESENQKPDFAEVEGQIIKLGGLDYNLLKQQSADPNQNILSKIKNKLNIISGNVLSRKINQEKLEERVISKEDVKYHDTFKKTLENQKGEVQKRKWKGKANSAFFYEFDLDPEFGRKLPTIVEKRLGKVEVREIFNSFDQSFLDEFGKLMNIKDFSHFQLDNQKDESQLNSEYSDSDDIFGDSNPDKDQKMKIKIGNKLDFGLDPSDDIFAQQHTAKRPPPSLIEEQQQKPEKDKYFFMRKKVKKATIGDSIADEGYGECYEQNGPSLKELVEMKKQGIQYFGDQKEFKAKERKPNINKDYQKIQRIIQEKNKK